MYIIANAAKNIRRYAGRYALFGVLIVIALTVGAISMTAERSIGAHITDILEHYGTTLRVTRERISIAPDDMPEIAQFPEVRAVDMQTFLFGFWPDSLLIDGKPLDLDSIADDWAAKESFMQFGGAFSTVPNKRGGPGLFLWGGDLSAQSGQLLAEGRLPAASGEILLRDDFSRYFHLPDIGVGSHIKLTVGWQEKEFTVVGLYRADAWTPPETSSPAKRYYPFLLTLDDARFFDDADNLAHYYRAMFAIYYQSSVGAAKTETMSYASHVWYDTVVHLYDGDDYDRVCEKVAALEQGEFNGIHYPIYQAEFYYPGAEDLLSAYRSAARIAESALTAVLILAAVVVLIMSALSMHERKYEIGVLLSMGMTKPKIALLFTLENLIFTLGTTVLAFAAGTALAPTAAEKLLSGVITLTPADCLSAALPMLALAAALSLLASSISALSILRFKPMTILRSRT